MPMVVNGDMDMTGFHLPLRRPDQNTPLPTYADPFSSSTNPYISTPVHSKDRVSAMSKDCPPQADGMMTSRGKCIPEGSGNKLAAPARALGQMHEWKYWDPVEKVILCNRAEALATTYLIEEHHQDGTGKVTIPVISDFSEFLFFAGDFVKMLNLIKTLSMASPSVSSFNLCAAVASF